MKPLYIYPYRNQTSAILCITDFFDICKSLNLYHCFIMGTALGLYRDHNFIPHDNDIDVFVKLNKESKPRFIAAMKEKGFAFNTILGFPSIYNMHFLKHSILLDVWFKTHPNFMRNFNTPNYINFKGLNIPVPDRIEEYLTTVFGDWKTPKHQKSNMFKGIPANQLRKKTP